MSAPSGGLRSTLLALTFAALAAAGGCGKGADEQAKQGQLVIGEFETLSGSEATFGKSTHNGVMLAVDEINRTGGVKGKTVRVICYDDEGKVSQAGTVVSRLVTGDKVLAVIGEVASSRSLAAAPICQQEGVPMVSPSSTNPEVTAKGDMIFRVCFIDPFQGYAMAKFAYDHLHARRVAILYDQQQAYSKGLREYFDKTFTGLGGRVLTVEAYATGDADFSAQLNKIHELKPDAIYVPGYYTDVGNIALQARAANVAVPLLGGDGWESPKLFEIGGAALDGCYYSNHMSFADPRPQVHAFFEAYSARYHEEPGALAALGYDAAKLLGAAMNQAPSLSGKDIADALAHTRGFPAVTGNITINAQRNADKKAVILKVEHNQASFVTDIEPPETPEAPK
jgi:branched-chain amino acid transport system substrate-binding protein